MLTLSIYNPATSSTYSTGSYKKTFLSRLIHSVKKKKIIGVRRVYGLSVICYFFTHGKVKISFKIMGLVLCLDKENKTTEIWFCMTEDIIYFSLHRIRYVKGWNEWQLGWYLACCNFCLATLLSSCVTFKWLHLQLINENNIFIC